MKRWLLLPVLVASTSMTVHAQSSQWGALDENSFSVDLVGAETLLAAE